MTEAFGGERKVAQSVGLNPDQRYRALSEDNPELRNLAAILRAMGLRLAVQPIHPAPATR
jgi:DNA-binding phage protein